MKLCDLDIEIDRICNEVCGHGRELCVWKSEGCNQIDSLEKAKPIKAIPIAWLIEHRDWTFRGDTCSHLVDAIIQTWQMEQEIK